MKASVLFGAGWEDDSLEVLWRDAGRVFCRLWRDDAEGQTHAFISTSFTSGRDMNMPCRSSSPTAGLARPSSS